MLLIGISMELESKNDEIIQCRPIMRDNKIKHLGREVFIYMKNYERSIFSIYRVFVDSSKIYE